MAIKCEIPSGNRKLYGFGKNFLKSVGLEKVDAKQLQALAKNLGVDDLRAVELRGEKAHMFGKNLADIKHWEGGEVKSNTIVKKQNPDGELEYFISRGKATTEPSKWVVNGTTIKPNPDWDYVGKNVTADGAGRLQRFSRKAGNKWVADDNGDTLLKITKPYDPNGKRPPAMYKLAEQGYDAIKLADGSYKLIHEPTQAVDPMSATLRDSYSTLEKEAVPTKPEDVTPEEVAQRAETLPIGRTMGYGLAGYAAGEMAENWIGEDGNYGWAGGAIGMLLSAPKVRSKIGTVWRGNKTNYTDQAKQASDIDKKHAEYLELYEQGYRGSPTDEAAKAEYKEKVVNTFAGLKRRGQEVYSAIFKNNLLQSGINQLKSIGIKAADDLSRIIRGLETHHTTLIREHSEIMERVFGKGTTDRQFRELQRNAVRRYAQAVGLSTELTDKQIDDLWGSAVFRVISYGTKLSDAGEFRFDTNISAAQKTYGNEVNREIDRFFLEDEQARNAIEVWRETFDKFGRDATKTYRKAVLKNMMDMGSAQQRVIQNILDSELSFLQWKENMPAGLAKAYKDGLSNPVFVETIQYIENISKINALEGRYIPQMRSPAKEDRARKLFIKEFRGKNPQATDKDILQAWNMERVNQIMLHNKDSNKAIRLSASGDNTEAILSTDFTKLLREYKDDLVYRIQNPEVRAKVVRDLDSQDPAVMDRYFGKINKNGKIYYHIKDPQINFGDGQTYDVLRDINIQEIEKAQRAFLNVTTLVQSDHLDNPRNFMLPTNMIETNMDNILQRYALDAGNKLYLVENGLDTARKLDDFLNRAKKELHDKGYGDVDVSKDLATIKAWYANATRTADAIEMNMSSADIIKRYEDKKRNHKLMSTLMNFGYMPFLWFTSFYSLFQPFITGPFLASHGNVWKSYKHFFKNPEALKNATDNMRKWGIMNDKVKSFSPELDYGVHEETFLNSGGSTLDWLYSLSQRGVQFSANFSLTKKILSHPAIGVDLENTGLLRFFGGSMMDISGVESAVTTRAVLHEIEDMVEAGAKLLRGEEGITASGKQMRMGDIRRRLEELGVDNVERFIEESSQFNGAFSKQLTGEADESLDIGEYLTKEYNKISDTIVNQLHGRTKTSRPLWWTNNPYGRLLSQFSVYAQNFAVQTVGQRIIQPIKDWIGAYNPPNDVSLMKMMWHMKQGNDDALKKIFSDLDGNLLRDAQGNELWRKAYDDFPVDAFDKLFKVMPAVMGTGAVMMATRDAVVDFVSMVGNEAIGNDDYEAWRRSKENWASLSDLFDGDEIGYDISKMAMSSLHNAVDMGFAGRAGQIFINESRYTQGGLWSKTPVTGLINDAYETVTTPFRYSFEDALPQTAKAVAEQVALRTPIIGSFHDFRKGLINSVFKKPKNRDVTFSDAETGFSLSDVSLLNE